MKYYGKITDDNDLITKEKGSEIAQSEISTAISSGSIKTELDKKINDPTTKANGQILEYNGTTWVAADKPTSGVWGQITGTLNNQTDLQNALDAKATISGENTFTNKNTFQREFTKGTNKLVMNSTYYDIFTCQGEDSEGSKTAISKGYIWNQTKSGNDLNYVQVTSDGFYYGKDTGDTTVYEGTIKFPQTNITEATLALAPTVVTGTLTTGQTTLTLSNSAITTNSIIDVYTDTYGISPSTVVASTGSITLTFKAQSSDLGVRVEVR